MQSEKPRILFLPAWYPHRDDAMFGLFVRNHALSLLPYANISVIYVHASTTNSNTYEIETSTKKDITEVKMYYKKNTLRIIGSIINLLRMLTAYRAAWFIINNTVGKPQLTHVHILTRAGAIALFLKLTNKIPYVITEHWSRYYSFNNTYKGWFRKFLTKHIVKKASAMSTVSNSLKTAMNEVGLQNNNWQIIPNSIDTKLFQPTNKEIKTTKIQIFHISCFEDKSKNVSGIIRAFAEALKQNKNLELIMIGDGEDHAAIVNLAKDLQISNSVKFTGVLQNQDLIDEIDSCQFSVMFSNYETFAIVIAESLAMQKPVIATRAGAIPEVLPEEYGILIPKKDETALSNAILKMAKEYSKFDGDGMRNYAIENYDIEHVGKELSDFYQKNIT